MLMLTLLLTGLANVAPAIEPTRVLILTGSSDKPYHQWQETTACLREILQNSGRFEVVTNEEPRAITAEALQGYDLLLINYNGPRWPAASESAIEAFVKNGKGLLAFHQASYGSFFGQVFRDGQWHAGPPGSGWQAFAQMIGATWDPKKLGHARRWVFPAEWKEPSHPICQQLPSPFMINDELYHRLDLAPNVQVLADAFSPDSLGGSGQREPIIWTNRFGKGRIFFTVLGHDAMAFYQSGMINAIARGAEWAATGQVTLKPIDSHHPIVSPNPIRMLVVTGGHSYPVSFYRLLDSLPQVVWTHTTSHEQAFAKPLEKNYDLVLLHDMSNQTSEQTRTRLKAFVESGKGVISLHHAIVDYTDWPWWYEEVIGGKYFEQAVQGHSASQYKDDQEFLIKPVAGAESHPVLRGVGPLWVFDEMYRNMWISDKVKVLMETDASDNDRPVVYVGPYSEARILYIQLGHSDHTMNHPGFRRLMQNAVQWVARRID